MPLQVPNNLGHGGTGMQGDGRGTVSYIIRQLAQQTQHIAAGAAASTDIAVAGLKVGDAVMTAFAYPTAGGNLVALNDLTVTTDGNVQTATDTTGHQIVFTVCPDVPA
ncbi:MAG: hypothetical protein LPH21_18185 [Shewanella sp.]|nr:hypothetical protein [Shewanella sp.]